MKTATIIFLCLLTCHGSKGQVQKIFELSDTGDVVLFEFTADSRQILAINNRPKMVYYGVPTGLHTKPGIEIKLPMADVDTMLQIDPVTGANKFTIVQRDLNLVGCHFSHNGKHLAVNLDARTLSFNLFTGQESFLSPFTHIDPETGIADGPIQQTFSWNEFSDDYIAIFTDSSLRIYNAGSGERSQQRINLSLPPEAICISTDRKFAAIINTTGDTVEIYSLESGACIHYIVRTGKTNRVGELSFSPRDNSLVVCAGNNSPEVYDASSGQLKFSLQGHNNAVLCARYSPDGKWILTVSADGTARIWNAKDGRILQKIEEPTSGKMEYARISPDGQYFLTAFSDWRTKITRAYVYSSGTVVPAANHRKRTARDNNDSRGAEIAGSSDTLPLSLGAKNFAVVIGSDRYHDSITWRPLANPISDARTIKDQLAASYGFQVLYLENPTKADIFSALDSVRQTIESLGKDANTNLLVFLAGHGGFDAFVSGFIVPTDATSPALDRYKLSYISHSQLRDIIDNIPAKHTLVMLDACYGGTFDQLISRSWHRGSSSDRMYQNINVHDLIKRKEKYATRMYITSGGKEYVPDGRPGRHSPFSSRFINLLINSNDAAIPITYRRICNELELLNPEPRSGEFGSNEPGSDFILVPNSLNVER